MPKKFTQSRFITSGKAAQLLGCDEDEIHRMVRQGILEARQRSDGLMIRRQDVMNLSLALIPSSIGQNI
jgi:hypothetical protein